MNNLEELLRFDALQEAENITGRSYKEDSNTQDLGMAMHILHSERKEEKLKELGDTPFMCSTEDYIEVIEALGFDKVYEEEFLDRFDNEQEMFYIFWDGRFMLTMDTFKDNRNSAKLYFNILPDNQEIPRKNLILCTNSVNKHDGVYYISGHVDAREALVYKYQKLLTVGVALTEWVDPPGHTFTWHHGDKSESEGLEARRKKGNTRMYKLPANLKEKINL